MDPAKLYSPEVLRDKVPTLHPRYQWMKLELEPDDRIVLTSISGRYTVGQIIELTGLEEDSVARVILKLVGRGVVLWDDTLPFYDEAALLEVMPTFDPQNINRNAHLDDTDRMLLTLINGRTSVQQMEAALPLSRDRLIASVIRLRLADVIGVAEPPKPTGDARAEAHAAAGTYQMPEGMTAPRPAPAAPASPAPPSAQPQAAAAAKPAGMPSGSDPGSGRVYKTRQDAFEEATRRLLSGDSLTPEDGDPTATPAPRRGTGPVRDPEPPRYARKPTKTAERKEAKKPRTAEVRARAGGGSDRAASGAGLSVGKLLIAAVALAAVIGVVLATTRGTSDQKGQADTGDRPGLSQCIDLVTSTAIQGQKQSAQAKAKWFELSAGDKRAVMEAFQTWINRDTLKGIVLTDEDGNTVAEWDGVNLTIYK